MHLQPDIYMQFANMLCIVLHATAQQLQLAVSSLLDGPSPAL